MYSLLYAFECHTLILIVVEVSLFYLYYYLNKRSSYQQVEYRGAQMMFQLKGIARISFTIVSCSERA